MGFIAGVSAAYAIASAVVRSRTQWPPDFPRRGTLLTPRDDPTTPRSEWGAREWKAYAQFLEEEGSQRVKQLTQAEAELRGCLQNQVVSLRSSIRASVSHTQASEIRGRRS